MNKSIEWIPISGEDKKYISEISFIKESGLPKGIINKKLADVGATFFTANCNSNYIIVCPTIDLLKSISSDKNNLYPIFECYSGIYEKDFNDFIEKYNPKYIKIAVTYDKFEKVSSWINPKEFKVLVDEYHLLLQTVDYRESAISSLFQSLEQYDYVSFISATPINPNYEVKQLSKLPHYEIQWNKTENIIPYRANTTNVLKTLKNFIKSFLSQKLKAMNVNGELKVPEELFIFLNSVNSIKQVCEDLQLDKEDVKICCSNKISNKKMLDGYDIQNVIDKNKKINFFTSKCFQGCNLFSNSGLIIVCSDGGRKSMMTDLSSDLVQIAGRLRFNDEYQNEFRNTMIHIFNTKNDVESDEEFEVHMLELKKVCNDLITIQNNNPEQAQSMISRLNLTNDIVVVDDSGKLVYSENKEMYFRYFHDLKKTYKNGINIRKSYNKENFEIINQVKFIENKKTFEDDIKRFSSVSYKDLLIDFYEATNKEQYIVENPEFADYYKYLTLKEVHSMQYSKERLTIAVNDKKRLASIIDRSLKIGFMPASEIKQRLKEEFEKEGITITPKASLVEKSDNYTATLLNKLYNGKVVKGYFIVEKN